MTGTGLTQSYDGAGLRLRKTENGVTTYYVRSSVLGGQVVAELNGSGSVQRGYVYAGSQLLALQTSGAVQWVHQEPYSKGQRITNTSGNVVSTVELDPWGGDTSRSSNQAFQPHGFTTYERDANGGDDVMMRRYQGTQRRFTQPDPYDGSFNTADPQSFNRYTYTRNDPVNFVDPSGLNMVAGGGGGWSCSGTWSAMLQPDGTITDFMITSMGCYSWGGGGDSGGEPQEPLPTNLKDQVQAIVTNCSEYMNDLLNKLGSKFTVETFGDLFDRVGMKHIEINHDKFVKVDEPTAAGLAEYDPRRIYINNTVTAIARVTTFELLHHAANRGGYSDHNIDVAVVGLMKPDDIEAAKKEMKQEGYMRSTIAHRELNKNCFSKGK